MSGKAKSATNFVRNADVGGSAYVSGIACVTAKTVSECHGANIRRYMEVSSRWLLPRIIRGIAVYEMSKFQRQALILWFSRRWRADESASISRWGFLIKYRMKSMYLWSRVVADTYYILKAALAPPSNYNHQAMYSMKYRCYTSFNVERQRWGKSIINTT